MIASFFLEWGGWSWILLAFILLGLEILAPGTFFLWFGLSALVVGLATFVFGDLAFWGWQIQMVSFVVLSLIVAILGRRYMAKSALDHSDNDLLNERSKQLVGRDVVLSEAISEGYGRAKVDDTIWRVRGEDMPKGSRVRVVGNDDGTVLLVEPVNS